MKVLATILLLIPMALYGQETAKDLTSIQGNDYVTINWGKDYDWAHIEVWAANVLIFEAPVKSKRAKGVFAIPKADLLKKRRSYFTVYVTRLRHGIVFRDSINIFLSPKVVQLRSPNTSSN